MKPFYYSKTLWVNFVVIVIALLGYVLRDDFPVQLPQVDLEITATILAFLNVVLRLMTREKLTK